MKNRLARLAEAVKRELRDADTRRERRKAERELRETLIRLESALEEKTVLLKEVHHRVKNNLAVVSSLLALKADDTADGEARLALEESQQRVQSIALVHEHLCGSDSLCRVNFADYATHAAKAEGVILGFLRASGASLGGSKSLVDLSGEGQSVLSCMTHMNQIGQTGATPRHPKGLSTCCHGEEPHVVGWRFVTERRAVNLDANCGWARGKSDVVYVGDAFAVMAEVNRLMGK